MEAGVALLKMWTLLLVLGFVSTKAEDVMRDIVDVLPVGASALELYTLVVLMLDKAWSQVLISTLLLVAQVWCFESTWVEYEGPCFVLVAVAAHVFRIIWTSHAKRPLYTLTAYGGYLSIMLSVSGDLCDYAMSKGSWV